MGRFSINPGRRSMNPAVLRRNDFSANAAANATGGTFDQELGDYFENRRRGSLGTGCV